MKITSGVVIAPTDVTDERMIAQEPVGEERGVIINTASIAAFDARSARPPIRHPKAESSA